MNPSGIDARVKVKSVAPEILIAMVKAFLIITQ